MILNRKGKPDYKRERNIDESSRGDSGGGKKKRKEEIKDDKLRFRT